MPSLFAGGHGIDFLRYQSRFWIPGSVENAIALLTQDAAMTDPPYQLKSRNGNFGGHEGVNELVFVRADHVQVIYVGPATHHGCELAFVQTHGYTPADYERKQNARPTDTAVPETP